MPLRRRHAIPQIAIGLGRLQVAVAALVAWPLVAWPLVAARPLVTWKSFVVESPLRTCFVGSTIGVTAGS